MNIFRPGVRLAAMTGLFLAIGYLIGGTGGMAIALVVAVGMNFFAYWNSGKMVLKMHNARQVDASSSPAFFNMIADLSQRAELPMPKVYLVEEDQPNAFATGRNPEHAAVAATTGLIRSLSREELSGVMAHELAHIKNRDTLTMTITATLAGAISMLANYAMFFGGRSRNNPLGFIGSIAIMILAPMAAMLVQMAISRTREYSADRAGAEICGNPLWLASALEKIASSAQRIPNEAAEANPATAHMFIINPLSSLRFDKLFSTHPDTASRVLELEKLAQEMNIRVPGNWSPSGPRKHSNKKSGPWS